MNKIIGGWELESWIITDGRDNSYHAPTGYKWLGTLIYTPDNYMAANIIIPPELTKLFKGIVPEYADKRCSQCLSYSGKYTLFEDRVIHHVKIANAPSWINTDQVRFFNLEEDKLTINSESESANGLIFKHVLVWKKSGSNIQPVSTILKG